MQSWLLMMFILWFLLFLDPKNVNLKVFVDGQFLFDNIGLRSLRQGRCK